VHRGSQRGGTEQRGFPRTVRCTQLTQRNGSRAKCHHGRVGGIGQSIGRRELRKRYRGRGQRRRRSGDQDGNPGRQETRGDTAAVHGPNVVHRRPRVKKDPHSAGLRGPGSPLTDIAERYRDVLRCRRQRAGASPHWTARFSYSQVWQRFGYRRSLVLACDLTHIPCPREPGDVFLKQPDGGVTSVAEQTADVARFMIVIDAEVLKNVSLVRRAFRRGTVEPRATTDSARIFLCLKDLLKILDR